MSRELITGTNLLRLGFKHDQRTGWFRDGKVGVIHTGDGWVCRKVIKDNNFIDFPKCYFMEELKKNL